MFDVSKRNNRPAQRNQNAELVLLLAAAFVVCLYVSYGIDRSVWLDEANSIHIANGSPKQVFDGLSRDVSPPLYYFLLAGWIRLFGDSEIAVRLPSILCYLAGICVMWFLGRMLLGTEGGYQHPERRAGCPRKLTLSQKHPQVDEEKWKCSEYAILAAIVLSSPVVWSIFARRWNSPAAGLRSALFLAFICAVVIGLPFLISIMKRPIFWPGRYDTVAVPFFALLAASLLLCLPRRPRLLFQVFLAVSCAAYFVQAVRASETTKWVFTLDPAPLGDRDAALAICAQSAPGDFVIYTGLSRAAVSYYLQRFKCSDKLRQVSYPAEVEQHMGWQDDRRNYSQEPAAKREAESAVDSAYASHARIFLLSSPNPRLSAGIVAAIQRHFRMTSSSRFVSCKPCFNEVRVYAPKWSEEDGT